MSYTERYFAGMYDLITCMTTAIDMISPEVSNHHQMTAYLSLQLAEQIRLPLEQKQTLLLAALLHDIGAFSLGDRLEMIEGESAVITEHALIGARLLKNFFPFRDAAQAIRYHHLPWSGGEGRTSEGETVPVLSHILHLADRIAVQVNQKENVIGQINRIRENIKSRSNTDFMPELVDAFLTISLQEALWLDLVEKPLLSTVPNDPTLNSLLLTLDEVVDLSGIFAYIIDFRSPFTARHSAAVAAVAEKLAALSGFSPDECKMMRVAGNLHDIGKLAIPVEILEKQDKLDPAEFDIIRSHSFYTYRLLEPIRGFETINQWAAYHHEKLNGKGYPFHLTGDSLSLGSRIMAVADIFTAITEDRPYRLGMSDEQTGAVLDRMVKNGSICPRTFSLLMEHFPDIARIRRLAAERAASDYNLIRSPGRWSEDEDSSFS